MSRGQVLVVDGKESVLGLMSSILEAAHDVVTTRDAAEAVALLEQRTFDVLLADVRMPGASGLDLLAAAKRCAAEPSVVLMTGHACVPDAVEAIRRGAFAYVPKPLEADEIMLVVARALQARFCQGCDGAPEGVATTDLHEAAIAARDRASRGYLVALMRQFCGNVTRAAIRAGMTRESLHRLLGKYEVHPRDYEAR